MHAAVGRGDGARSTFDHAGGAHGAFGDRAQVEGGERGGDSGATYVPQPTLATLTDLVESVSATGTPVGLELDPDLLDPREPVPAGVELCAYRVVQEALTNVRKHAGPGASVSVRVAVGREVVVEVRDDGRHRLYRLNGHALKPIYDWVRPFERSWNQRLDALDDLLAELKQQEDRDDGDGN